MSVTDQHVGDMAGDGLVGASREHIEDQDPPGEDRGKEEEEVENLHEHLYRGKRL